MGVVQGKSPVLCFYEHIINDNTKRCCPKNPEIRHLSLSYRLVQVIGYYIVYTPGQIQGCFHLSHDNLNQAPKHTIRSCTCSLVQKSTDAN
jgi:hypothetical protein